MSKELSPELKSKIAKEATSSAANFHYYPGSEAFEDMESSYETGASRYAVLWQQAEQRAARYEKALKEIQAKAKQGIFPHLPVETMGAQMCIDIDQYITDLLTPKQTADGTANG